MSVHESAAKGYAVAAETYVHGRPGYPPEAVDWIREVVAAAPGKRVLDLGAGTGKFLPVLRASGATLLALEPVDAMRVKLAQSNPDVETLSGTAESIPLPDASIEAIVCAQAFHWFSTAKALAEMRRVLIPGGTLGLIWNTRDESVPWVAALSEITESFEAAGTPRYRSGAWRHAFPAEGFTLIGERYARNSHIGPSEAVVIDRTLSVSFIAALPEEQRAEVERKVRSLIAHTPELQADSIAFPYETLMVAYRKTG